MEKIIKNSKNRNNYYIENREKFGKQFKSLIKVGKKRLSSIYSPEIANNLLLDAQIEFNNILTKLTYVGGDKSPYTSFMMESAITLAFIKASKLLQSSNYEVGKLVYEITENYAQANSAIKKWIYRKVIFSKKMKKKWRYWAKESQKRKYSENWVCEFIEGDGKDFDYGLNFTECGWLKLIENEGLREIAPYACLCDYARMRAFGIGFKRTKTIAAGAEFCDFRFIKDYETPRGWPPEDLEENKEFYSELKRETNI
jgi:hypothetical protein